MSSRNDNMNSYSNSQNNAQNNSRNNSSNNASNGRSKNNMKNSLMTIADKILLRKRALIETVNDELKNIAQIEHSRHRSFNNFIAND